MKRGIGVVALVLALAVPTGAAAGTRFAAPDGGMAPGCPQLSPCSLEIAITGAAAGDEVIVAPGTYAVGTAIEIEKSLYIHGQEDAPRPRIVGASGVTPFKSFASQRLSYLTLEATDSATGVLFTPGKGTELERLELLAHGENALGLRAGNEFTLTDSVIWAGESTGAAGLFLQGTESGDPTLRNDTIVAAGPESVGISIFVTQENTAISMLAINVIAAGESDAAAAVSPERAKSSAVIHFDHSNLDTTEGDVVSTAGQTAQPVAPGTRIARFKLRHRRATVRFVAFGTAEPVTFECKLDRRPFRACRSPKTLKHLRSGRHAFRVRAVAAGLTDPTPAVRKFKVKRKHRHRRAKAHR